MTSTLETERKEIAALLNAAGLTAHENVPDRMNAPCAVVYAGSPYLQHNEDDPRRSFTATYGVTLVIREGASNATATDLLDEHIERATVALLDNGFIVDDCGIPYPLKVQNATFLAADLTTTTTLDL